MAVALDAVSSSTSGTSNRSWTHTPVGTPRSVLVLIVQDDGSGDGEVDHVTGVTYGGTAMARIGRSAKASSEFQSVYAYFLGSSIPTGAQTVLITVIGSSRKRGHAFTLTASADTEVVDVDDSISSDSQADPSVTLALSARTCFVALGFVSGHGVVSSIVNFTDWTERNIEDVGGQVYGAITYDIIDSANVSAGWTQTAEDANAVCVAISEVSGDPATDITGIDTTAVGLADLASGVVTVAATDAPGIRLQEVGSVESFASDPAIDITGIDTVAVRLQEIASVVTRVNVTDTLGVRLLDVGSQARSISAIDPVGVRIGDVGSVETLAPTIIDPTRTQLIPSGRPSRPYGPFFARAIPLTTADLAERQGAVVHTLFELSVTHPVAKSWYLCTVDLAPPPEGMFDPFTFDPGTFALGWGGEVFQGLILSHSGVSASASLGGVGTGGGVGLTLTNALGTGGQGRRFMDQFATPVPGYDEPYDLLTMTCRVALLWDDLPTQPLAVGAFFALAPGGYAWSAAPGEPETVSLSFNQDERRYVSIPQEAITAKRYPHAPESILNTAVPIWLGVNIKVALSVLDADGALFMIGASPTATPLTQVRRLWTLRPDPSSVEASNLPTSMPVKITTAGEAVLTIAGNATAVLVTQIATRFELVGDGAFVSHVRLRLKRAAGATPCVGSITVEIVLDADGLPGDGALENAVGEVDASIVTTGSFAAYDIPFSANIVARAAYLPPNRGLWCILRYQKTSGDMHVEVDGTGAYQDGYMATMNTATDQNWVLVGQQQRRGPVALNYTGIGYLLRAASDGAITVRPPVSIPGR